MKLTSFIKETVFDAARILTAKEGLKSLYGVSLYRNAIYLLLNSAIALAAGFVFWMIAARLYAVESVGLASAALSAVGLLVSMSTLGLGYGLIRFLPGAGEKAREMLNSCLTIGGIVSVALSLVFLAGLNLWSPALLPIRAHLVFAIAFIAFAVASTLFVLAQHAFIAKRRAGFALSQGLLANLLRFIPMVTLAAILTSFGVFASWGIAILVAGAVSILLFLPLAQTGYRPLPIIRRQILKDLLHFSLGNYLASLLELAPGYILPIMVINLLGAEQNAYFYIGWTVGGIITTIPGAIFISLFAEGSHNEKELNSQVKRSLKFLVLILVPVVVVILLLANQLLLLFGIAYSQNATTLLQVSVISTLPLSVNSLYFNIKRVKMEMKNVVILSGFIATATLGLSYFLLPQMGILATAIAWLAIQGIVALLIIAVWLKRWVRTNP